MAWRSDTVITFHNTATYIDVVNMSHTSGHHDVRPMIIDVTPPTVSVAHNDGPEPRR